MLSEGFEGFLLFEGFGFLLYEGSPAASRVWVFEVFVFF
jgi:hypothetical protein